jgi:uncharacterized membrane protein
MRRIIVENVSLVSTKSQWTSFHVPPFELITFFSINVAPYIRMKKVYPNNYGFSGCYDGLAIKMPRYLTQ